MSTPTIVPLAQRLAEENNVNWRSLSGSGPGGSVTEVDVLNYLARVMAGEEDLNPTAEPVPEGMEAWPEEDVRAHKMAQAQEASADAGGAEPVDFPDFAEEPAVPQRPQTPVAPPAAAPPSPAAPQPAASQPQPSQAQAAPQTSPQSDAKPYVKKEAYLELLQKHKALTEQYTALTNKLSAGEAEAARSKTQASSLEGELATAKAQITTLKGEVATLKEQVKSLTKERDGAGAAAKRLPMLENENEGLKTALAEEQAKVTRHRKELEELQSAAQKRPWWKFWG